MCPFSPKAKQTFFLIRVHPCSSACPMKSLLHLFHRGVLIVLSFETWNVQLFCKYGINPYLQPLNQSTNQLYLDYEKASNWGVGKFFKPGSVRPGNRCNTNGWLKIRKGESPRLLKYLNSLFQCFGHWILGFEICLKFGACNLEFPCYL